MTNPPTDTEILAVLDATHEVAAAQPRKALNANVTGLRGSVLRDALQFVPSEHHSGSLNLAAQFMESVVANARALDRSPYTVALFALDA